MPQHAMRVGRHEVVPLNAGPSSSPGTGSPRSVKSVHPLTMAEAPQVRESFASFARPSRVSACLRVFVLVSTAALSAATARAQATELTFEARLLPGDRPARLPHDTGAESGAAQLGARADFIPLPTRRRLPSALRQGYRDLHAAVGIQPSVWRASVEAPQGSEAFDTLLVTPGAPSDLGVVFLHGYGGNIALACVDVARAAAEVGGRTSCPSVGPEGAWWTAIGRRIVRAAVDDLVRRGARRIVLAGLSNGAVGVSRLAPRLRSRLAGVLLISGAGRGTRTELPALVVQGRQDRMTPRRLATAFAHRSARAELVLMDEDHFLLLHRSEEVRRRITAWLGALHSPGVRAHD
ncbi:MAG: alpha/beta hydrolase [Sandaracinaceae bacterium]